MGDEVGDNRELGGEEEDWSVREWNRKEIEIDQTIGDNFAVDQGQGGHPQKKNIILHGNKKNKVSNARTQWTKPTDIHDNIDQNSREIKNHEAKW